MASRAPLMKGEQSYATVTDHISSTLLDRRTPRVLWYGFALFFLMAMGFLYGVTYLFVQGVGVFGLNIPVAWGFPIINTVWWIGIGHAGTLISAILLLLNQRWRTSINRFAEAMTIFAASMAGLFPILHLGRPWFAYWLIPYPNTMGLWPQWRSPLIWDFFAIATYLTVSALFWYMGMIPDLATLRDRAKNPWSQGIYGALSLGWRGSAIHWHRYQTAYLLLAGLATPLVVSVHSIVALDFAVAITPGYHSTIFPPYFVAGALYSGFAMALTIAIPLRAVFKLDDFITLRHLNVMGKVMLAAGMIVAYGYIIEVFIAYYSGDEYHRYMMINRAMGPYAWWFWGMLICNVVFGQLLWFRWVRTTPVVLFFLSIVINVGMWLERYVIVITSEHRGFLPSMWDTVSSTPWDWLVLFGSIGLFFTLMFVFVRLLPVISMAEMRELVHEQHESGAGAHGSGKESP